jgi:hypothetical protein
LIKDSEKNMFLGEFKYGKPEGNGTFIKKEDFSWKGEVKNG